VVHDYQFLISMNDDEAVAGALGFAFKDSLAAASQAALQKVYVCGGD
jgi:hypothetical protein